MTEAIVNNKEKKQSPLRWLDENFESIFLVIGMLAIIFSDHLAGLISLYFY